MTIISETTLEELSTLIQPICDTHGVELVVVEQAQDQGGAVLRVVIDRLDATRSAGDTDASGHQDASGVSLEDCTGVSRDVSALLDVHEELLPRRYRLEVSSPGLDRPLVRPKDYRRFLGRRVKVRTKEPVGGRRRFCGRLAAFEHDSVQLELDDQSVEIPLTAIARANLVYEQKL